MWRAAALASYRFNPEWSATFDARYSGVQYRTLNNADVNGFTFQGVSKFFTADVRVVCKINKTVTAAVSINNVKNYQYWNFHRYPQRSNQTNLRADF